MRHGFSAKESYINEVFAKESETLKRIRERSEQDQKSGIQVGPFEGSILKFLVSMVKAKTILEVGTLYGYSAQWMAEALPKDGQLISIEKNKEHFTVAKELLASSPQKEQIFLMQGDAEEVLAGLSRKVDVVFVDANKAGYAKYMEWADKNLNEGGLIIGDNTFLFGHVYGEGENPKINDKQIESMKRFNQELADNPKYETVMIPTNEGLTVARKIN